MKYTFIHLKRFETEIRRLGLTLEDLLQLQREMMSDPTRHPLIEGTGGLRKMRFAPAARGGGKSGGIRVCFFVVVDADHIYLVTAYLKKEKGNLTAADKKDIAAAIRTIKSLYPKKG